MAALSFRAHVTGFHKPPMRLQRSLHHRVGSYTMGVAVALSLKDSVQPRSNAHACLLVRLLHCAFEHLTRVVKDDNCRWGACARC